MSSAPDHFVLICSTCEGPEGAARLRSDLLPELPDCFGIRAVDCLAGCEQPIAVGFQAQGKASYVFGPIEGRADSEALVKFAHQFSASQSGWTSATDRPSALFHKTLARLPALPDQQP
ncbi:DUF1636 family protein [Shimia haliotis]|uniref:Predicted metal-binding protein n=1 Tax=Shimia haliotis TaxID=1280847 RepID=A0A1I4E8L8_9RHOB|nr:DUF1636 family protein [Shimia haliotis]SFL00706.1 Predicted metal-binding protein [Shimia haliotis]